MSFKSHLERLVKEGHLKDYIKEENSNNIRARQRQIDEDSDEPEGIINVIHLAPAPKENPQTRIEARRASYNKQVMTVELEPSAKKARTERPRIWFSNQDLKGVQLLHNDPLVLTLKLKNFVVKRVLVGPGSSSEILYFDYYKKLGLKEDDLQESHTPLIGFSSKPIYPKGRVSLKVQTGGASRQADFLVVDVPSPYNAIMGRTWLHSMEVVPSTHHQKLKFPLEKGDGRIEVVTLRGDQEMAKHCLMAVAPGEAKPSQIHMAELEAEL